MPLGFAQQIIPKIFGGQKGLRVASYDSSFPTLRDMKSVKAKTTKDLVYDEYLTVL